MTDDTDRDVMSSSKPPDGVMLGFIGRVYVAKAECMHRRI